ncbi:DUF2971 domain-containing protein [Methylacidiphilum caldifontis]|uniref:DUF2971 domain-containing protein n=1 Tax=Methylacidiphilum caldifontis TaxID=2795386 RepID=UPI001A8D2232|nr:DUF2971 domain-containing protein [Methylacidiphilum caldifontis]QSR88578.1 DUF2971 domain-containing protein [Methylacidiphilum caldifontis]
MDIPSNVIRFYSEPKYALEVISNLEIAFIHSNLINDPFDPYFFFETDFDESYQKLSEYIKRKYPSDYELWYKRCVTEDNWNRLIKEINEIPKSIKKSLYYFCTCKKNKEFKPEYDLYMWSHYANGHRGVAIEFNAHQLEENIKKFYNYDNSKNDSIWIKIEYVDDIDLIPADMFYEFYKQEYHLSIGKIKERKETKLEERYYTKMDKIKSKVWEREHEWRIQVSDLYLSLDYSKKAQSNQDIKTCSINNSSINSIYLGLLIDDEFSKKIIQQAKQMDVKIYKACKEKGRFALKFDRIY